MKCVDYIRAEVQQTLAYVPRFTHRFVLPEEAYWNLSVETSDMNFPVEAFVLKSILVLVATLLLPAIADAETLGLNINSHGFIRFDDTSVASVDVAVSDSTLGGT